MYKKYYSKTYTLCDDHLARWKSGDSKELLVGEVANCNDCTQKGDTVYSDTPPENLEK